MTEEWRPIVGFSAYMVSDHGRVYSHFSQKILRPGIGSHGYPTVRLTGKKTRTLHSLVAETFIGPRPEGMEVRHKDGDRTNPALANLCYGTPSQNRADAYTHGTRSKATDTEAGQKARDTKMQSNPDFFKVSNRKGVLTKDSRYGRAWSRKSFAGERYAK